MPIGHPHPHDTFDAAASMPECTFPRLKDRLIRMINYDEPFAFEIILQSECHGLIDTSHPKYFDVYRLILHLSTQRDMSPYLISIMKNEAYNAYMFVIWTLHRPFLHLNYLQILKDYFKHPDGSMVYSISLKYPQNSPERDFFNSWLVELQRPTLKWPFKTESALPALLACPPPSSPSKVKSNVLGEESIALEFQSLENYDGISEAAEPSITDHHLFNNLNFGHIYGWISKAGNPIVSNSNQAFTFHGHTVKLHDTFMGFASSKFNLKVFAESAFAPNSFFLKNNSALSQKIRTVSGRNFAVSRIVRVEDGAELQAILKGDLTLVVLESIAPNGTYDYKYPHPSNIYNEFVRGTKGLRSISVPISSADIVLFLPRILFTDPDICIQPHDVPGFFHFTDLKSFPASFVQFINYIHFKTSHHGLVAVGGYVHESHNNN